MSSTNDAKNMLNPTPSTSEPAPPRLATASECEVEEQNIPNTVPTIKSFGFLKSDPKCPHRRVVANCTQQMASRQRRINAEEKQAVFSILMAFNSLETFSADMNKKLSIDSILRNILGETNKNKIVKPYEYPEPLQRNAAMILDRLEIELAAEIDLEAEPTEPTKPDATRPLKRRRKSSTQTSATELSQLRFEDPGLKHVMRGIAISGKSRRAYLLDRTYTRRDYHVIGHNGLEVGDWWPLRVCALRDGAHGAIQGGIAGSSNDGAYSIVVSNGYSELDRDLGNTIYYSGSNSQENTNAKVPQLSYATKAMRVSCSHRTPVRVLRADKAEGKYAPSKGLRYDGLYRIESEAMEINQKGGAYVRFKLVRCEGQKDIDLSRPNRKEREIADTLKTGARV